MLKSILSVLGSALMLLMKILLVIGLCFTAGYCLLSMLARPFIWGGLIRLAGAAACVLAVWTMVRKRNRDEEAE